MVSYSQRAIPVETGKLVPWGKQRLSRKALLYITAVLQPECLCHDLQTEKMPYLFQQQTLQNGIYNRDQPACERCTQRLH